MEKKRELSRYEKQSQERIVWLIREYCDSSQHNFCQKTGLNKGSVSQYVNGKNTISNINAGKVGNAFNVSPMWVMGFDVPMAETLSNNIENHTYNAALKINSDRPYIQEMLFDMRAKALDINDSDLEIISLYKSLEKEKQIYLIEILLELKANNDLMMCNNTIEKNILIAFRNASTDIKNATCAVLGIKGDSELSMENAINE